MARKPKIDHTQMGKKSRPAEKSREWWLLEDEQIPETVEAIVRTIKAKQSRLEAQRVMSARLAGNLSLFGMQGMNISKASAMQPAVRDRITYNVIQSASATVTSKMAKNKPKPFFLTDGGDYKVQRQAKDLTKYVEGMFYENRIRRCAPRVFRESTVFGDGFIHVFENHDRVCMERMLCSELYVDDTEALMGAPRQAHRAKSIDRRVLLSIFPKYEKEILQANPTSPDEFAGIDANSVADQVAVVESWHLKSGPEADDGCHTICLPECVLYRGKWEHDFFPFARMPWEPPLYGYWSRGLAESIQNIQLEMNKLLWLIQRSMHLMGTFKIALEYGSKVVASHLTNDIGAIIWYNQNQPVYLTPQVVPAEYYMHFERLKAAAYDQAGISELAATSEKPAGLNSGKALREYEDIGSDRFQTVGQQYEEFHLELARMGIAIGRDIVKRTGKLPVKVPGKKFIESIDLADIDIDDESYVMQCFPISALAHDPSARVEQVVEWAQAGLIPQQLVRRLADFPDLEQFDTLQDALIERAEKQLGSIVDDGKYEPPDPYLLEPTDFARQLAAQYYNRLATQNLEPERLDMLQEWMEQYDELKQQVAAAAAQVQAQAQMQAQAAAAAQAPQGQGVMPQGGPPEGVPQQPPQAEMLPTTPAASA